MQDIIDLVLRAHICCKDVGFQTKCLDNKGIFRCRSFKQ